MVMHKDYSLVFRELVIETTDPKQLEQIPLYHITICLY